MLHTIPLEKLLAPHRGVISVIGSGGKSTLLACGGRALAQAGRTAVLATSTHMFRPKDMELVHSADHLARALASDGIACVGEIEQRTGKLVEPAMGFSQLAAMADHVLVEADGSHRLPLKAHAPHEPVIPAQSALTIMVVGASGFRQPVQQAVHRPNLFCELVGCDPQDIATPDLVARAMLTEGLAGSDDLVVINQIDRPDLPGNLDACRAFALALGREVLAGSLRSGALVRVG